MEMCSVITESGMDFIGDNVFHIEKTPLYASLMGVRSVEFIRCMDDKLIFVEAKTTFTNPDNPVESNYTKFLVEIDEICEKFIHSINVYSSIVVGANDEPMLECFYPPANVFIRFVLVIRTHKKEWCKPVYAKIMETLPSHFKQIWKPEVQVINHETAFQQRLTIS